MRYLLFVLGLIGVLFLSGCNSSSEWVDWTKDMHAIGDTVGSYETTDMQIIVRNASIARVDGSNKLVLSIRMANNTPYYIQLYNGNFNVYDHSLGEDSYPLPVYGMNAGYSYFPLGDEYSRLPEASNYGINSVDFYLAFNISSSTDINNLYLAVNLGDIDYGQLQFYSIYLGNGLSNIEDDEVKISFVTNNDSSLLSKTVQYEGEYGALPTIEKTGYEFEGWYLNGDFSGQKIEASTNVTNQSDHILYAKWIAKTYQVTLKYNDGITPDTVLSVTYDEPYGFNQPSRNGYEIIGWYDTIDFSGIEIKSSDLVDITSDITLYAKWEPLINVTLEYNNPQLNNEIRKIPLHSYYELSTPESNYGFFAGWYFDSEYLVPITTESFVNNTEAHTVYAKMVSTRRSILLWLFGK